MTTDEHTKKLSWEAPAATALTDAESRADVADVWLDNGSATS